MFFRGMTEREDSYTVTRAERKLTKKILSRTLARRETRTRSITQSVEKKKKKKKKIERNKEFSFVQCTSSLLFFFCSSSPYRRAGGRSRVSTDAFRAYSRGGRQPLSLSKKKERKKERKNKSRERR